MGMSPGPVTMLLKQICRFPRLQGRLPWALGKRCKESNKSKEGRVLWKAEMLNSNLWGAGGIALACRWSCNGLYPQDSCDADNLNAFPIKVPEARSPHFFNFQLDVGVFSSHVNFKWNALKIFWVSFWLIFVSPSRVSFLPSTVIRVSQAPVLSRWLIK